MGQRTYDTYQQSCATCGSTFEYRLSKNGRHRNFCSRPCFNRARRGEGQYVAPPRQFAQTTACESCASAIPKKTHNARWCQTCVPNKSARERMRRYGVSYPVWAAMVAAHGGMCWLCRENEPTVIDHCHETGRVRGALCDRCNIGLGFFETAGWQAMASAYLATEEVVSPYVR